MTSLIKNETTLLDAFRIQEDVPWWVQYQEFQDLSLRQKITRLVSDYIIKFFAYVLGVKISGRNVEAVGRRYHEYANAKEQNSRYSLHQKVILVLHIKGSIPTEPKHFKELTRCASFPNGKSRMINSGQDAQIAEAHFLCPD